MGGLHEQRDANAQYLLGREDDARFEVGVLSEKIQRHAEQQGEQDPRCAIVLRKEDRGEPDREGDNDAGPAAVQSVQAYLARQTTTCRFLSPLNG